MIAFQLQNKKPSSLLPNANTVELWLKEGNRVSQMEVLVSKGVVLGDLYQEIRGMGYCLTVSQLTKLESAIANF